MSIKRESQLLAGVVVVDLSSNIAAPFTGAILADLGADVVHIEPPTGDDSRRMSPTQGNASAYFYVVNRNKMMQTLDLREQADRDSLIELLRAADVFVSNLRPRKLTELGLNEASIRARFPQLITAVVALLPVPVAPRRTEFFSPDWIRLTSASIAAG